jgi:hypothetical protein
MATKLVIAKGPVQWPAACAMCGVREDLVGAEVKIDRITSIRPGLTGDLSIGSQVTRLNYPVCRKHARGLRLATLLIQDGGGIGMLRTASYLFGPLTILMLLASAKRAIFGSHAANGAEMPLAFALMFAVFLAMFVAVLLAYPRVPLRLSGKVGETLTLVFRNRDFAAAFARLNPGKVRNQA